LDATPLLGGLSPAQFMRRHWQKKPLLVRQAVPGGLPLITRAALFALAADEDVESRLVVQQAGRWSVRQGPLPRRALPAVGQPGWTLLVQGLEQHVVPARQLLDRFRFVPEARLDDLMLSWASDGGGVGPHLDSYDVFLLQVHGSRRWRIGRVADTTFEPDQPLKILRHFAPEHEWMLEAGDMLYLPPRWGHDGVAVGECMTASVGFRAPAAGALLAEMLARLGDEIVATEPGLYRDPSQPATEYPGALPPQMLAFAQAALARTLRDPGALARALGEALTEPKPKVWFEPVDAPHTGRLGVRLHPASRMLYDDKHVFLNGESFVAAGRDARLMQALADRRQLSAASCAGLSAGARALLQDWLAQGWMEALT
jgi:50S ribosomal protein L16 3-hydroxylase